MRTTTAKTPAPSWYLLNADGKSLGRLAARIAHMLRGKHKTTFSPHQPCGDHIVLLNVSKLAIPASKFRRKVYFSHTGYLGHWSATSLRDLFAKDPVQVIEKAVHRMLPPNRLRPVMMGRFHAFADDKHPYAPQKPVPLDL